MSKEKVRAPLAAAARFLLNNLDTWGATLIIASLVLLIHDAFSLQTTILLLALTAGYWLAFALNDFFDAPYDAIDSKKGRRNFFVRYPRATKVAAITSIAVSVFILVAFLQFGWRGVLALAVGVFVMWGYSAPPLRFKGRPGVDLLVHAVFVETFPYLVTLFLIGARWYALDYVLLTIFFLASLTAQLEQQVRDFAVDKRSGESTFATTFGRARTVRLLQASTALLILIACFHIIIGTIPAYIAVLGIIALPALMHRFLRPREKARSEKLIYVSAMTALVYMGVVLVWQVFRS